MENKKIRVGIVGVSGYTGKEVLSLLLKHDGVRVTYIAANNTVGPISAIYPEFLNRTTLVCEKFSLEKSVKLCDVIFLALPHTESMVVAGKLLAKKIKVIDLSADYRLKDPKVYAQWYGHKHKDEKNITRAVYGLPELYRTKIKKANLIANPGCYPTAAILGLAPLVSTRKDIQSIIIDAKSGVSGAGRKASVALLQAEVNENFKAYKVLSHQHNPEIDQILSAVYGKAVHSHFVAHLLPINRGILDTIYVQLKTPIELVKLHDLYKKFYKMEPFVRIHPLGSQPEVKNLAYTNFCDIGLALSADKRMVVVTSAIDNLVKGAAGQAVQNMNIMFDFNGDRGIGMKIVAGGICAPKGFLGNGIAAGIKRSGKPDLGLIVSEVPAVTAGVFTINSIKAAPLLVSMKHIKSGISRAVLVNSGNANCYTGSFGLKYAQQSTALIGDLLGVKQNHVLVTSTGIIGKQLPYNKIIESAGDLVKGLSAKNGGKFATAIMTTDLVLKEIAVEITLEGKRVTIGGCAKGSGMIEPNMATMLGFITTDAAISLVLLKKALKEATDRSFNSITVDGCMSTNDMVTLQANGLAKNSKITTVSTDYKKFVDALIVVCKDLAKKIVLDGEGATKFITVNVSGAANDVQAKRIAKSIANSPLVKTAAFGSNPNWGRVGAAVGSLGIKGINEDTMKIGFSPFDKKDIAITVELQLGKAKATVYTCDLSYDYVKINGEYN